jgi:hypothetical protein
VQRLRDAVADRVHTHTGAEVDADGLGSVFVDGRAQPVAEIVQAGLPCGGPQLAVDADERVFEAVVVVVNPRQRTSLRAGVALRERVIAVPVSIAIRPARRIDASSCVSCASGTSATPALCCSVKGSTQLFRKAAISLAVCSGWSSMTST